MGLAGQGLQMVRIAFAPPGAAVGQQPLQTLDGGLAVAQALQLCLRLRRGAAGGTLQQTGPSGVRLRHELEGVVTDLAGVPLQRSTRGQRHGDQGALPQHQRAERIGLLALAEAAGVEVELLRHVGGPADQRRRSAAPMAMGDTVSGVSPLSRSALPKSMQSSMRSRTTGT